MKKVLIGLLILSSITLARFEKQFGLVETEKVQNTTFYEMEKNKTTELAITKLDQPMSNSEFLDKVELLGNHIEITDTGENFIGFKMKDGGVTYAGCMFLNHKNELIMFTGRNSAELRKIYEYLKMNGKLSSDNGADLSLTLLGFIFID